VNIIFKTTPPEASNVQSAADYGVLKPLKITAGDFYYLVDFGEGIIPRYHYVFNTAGGMICLCAQGANCPATMFVQEHRAGIEMQLETAADEERRTLAAELIGQMPEGHLLTFIPKRCPECGGLTSSDPIWNGKYTGQKGWKCLSHGISCFIRYKGRGIAERRRQNPDPWIIPPVEGYPGVRLNELGLPGHPVYLEPGEPAPLPSMSVLCGRSDLEPLEPQPIRMTFGIPINMEAQVAG
jgi:hypothetical protein